MARIYILCVLAFLVAGVIAEELLQRVKRASRPKCPQFSKFNGKVKYRRRGTRAVFKCSKGFTRYGNRAVNCRADKTWSGEAPVCIKANCVPMDIRHIDKLDMKEMYGGALLSFVCEDDYQLIGATEIHCDGKVWSADLPACQAPTQLLKCGFETDLCGWSQDDTDDLDWVRHQGHTSTGGTGPNTDHTLQTVSGHYMFVESSSPAKVGDQARLLSPEYPADMGDRCFEFWYHMLGPDDTGHVGTLEVYILGESQFIDDLQPVFVKDGNQGNVWRRGEIYIDKTDEPYQIVIATTRKLSYISDIAIDDVRLYNCSVTTTRTSSQSTEETSSTESTSPTTTLTTTTEYQKLSSPTTTTSTISSTKIPTKTSSISSVSSTASSTMPSIKTTSEMTTIRKSSSTKILSTVRTPSVTVVTTATTKPSTSTTTVVKSPPPTKSTTKSSSTPSTHTTTVTRTSTASTTSRPLSSKISTTAIRKKTTITSTESTTTQETSTIPPSTLLLSTTTVMPTTTRRRKTTTTTTTTPKTKTSPKTSSMNPDTSKSTKTTTMTFKSTERTKPTTATTKAKSTKAILKTTAPSKTSRTLSSTLVSKGIPEVTSTMHPQTSDRNNTNIKVSIGEHRSKHPDDETLKPLMIGLGVGIFCGLIVIGVIAWVCVRRRKFYTSRYEDELKPITKSSSNDNFTGVQYEYHDDEYEQ